VDDGEILSAGHAAAMWLREQGLRRVSLLLSPSAREDYTGFDMDAAAPDAVVVGDMGRDLTFDLLNGAFRALHGGARLVATQKNRFWKAADGWTIDAGAFVAALEYAAGVEAVVVGKPAPGFFHAAAAQLGVPVEELTIVGDDLESDIAGGRAAGLRTVLVRTGKFDEGRLARVAEEGRPDLVVDSIRDVASGTVL
jgi:HAD superfamily hydrolase (TIGR01458 family)